MFTLRNVYIFEVFSQRKKSGKNTVTAESNCDYRRMNTSDEDNVIVG